MTGAPHADEWDRQIEADAKSGKLDRIFLSAGIECVYEFRGGDWQKVEPHEIAPKASD